MVWLLVLILVILHQDFWNWNSDTLVFGFIPIGLFYHIGISLAAGFVWWLACTFAWPKELEEFEIVEKEVPGKGGQAS